MAAVYEGAATASLVRSKQTLQNVQALRFFAAAMVVLAHIGFQQYGVPGSISDLGGIGVDIFFVISGFIIPFMIYGSKPALPLSAKMTPVQFFVRRVVRIWPLYAAATFAVVLISLVIGVTALNVGPDIAYHYSLAKVNVSWIISTLTFTHIERPPILTIGWTLQFEFIFYSLFALGLMTRPKTPAVILAYYCGFLIAISALHMLLSYMGITGNLFAYTALISHPIMVEFAFGITLYCIYATGYRSTLPTSLAVVVLAVIWFWLSSPYGLKVPLGSYTRPLTWGVSATALVWVALSLEEKLTAPSMISDLGDSSYSLYITHALITPILAGFWAMQNLNITVPIYVYVPTAFAFCLAAALACYRWFEKPIHRYFKERL